jgi:tetratricopeptide (TPR) repeat protein
MSYDVFISYSSIDKAIADGICKKLEQDNLKCWIAPRNIHGGLSYGTEILDGLNNSKIVVLVFSSNSNSSHHVPNEIERAISIGKIIIPFRIENIKPTGDMELFLSRRHWIDAIPPPVESYFSKLSDEIHHLLKRTTGEKPVPDKISKLKNGYYFIVEQEDPYYLKFRDLEVPITFNYFKSQNEKANIWYSQAEKMFYNLKIEESIRFYKRTIEEDPKFQEAYLKLALIPWLFPNSLKPEDSFNHCRNGFEVNNTHLTGSFLTYLLIENHRTEEAKKILDELLVNKDITNTNQLAGLHFLQSKLHNMLKDFEKENESLMSANQISPFFGPALRQRARIHLEKKEFNEAELLLKNGMVEYSKFRYCRNWLNTRDLLISVYGNSGNSEMTLDLLKENNHIQKLMNNNYEPQNLSSNIFFEGDIDGNVHKGFLANGNGFDITNGYLQDGIELADNLLCGFEINESLDYCIFYDHRFGGAIVRIDNISFLVKIVQGSNTGSLIQTRNEFKLSGIESGFPNLWFISSTPSLKPINLSEAKSFNLKRV